MQFIAAVWSGLGTAFTAAASSGALQMGLTALSAFSSFAQGQAEQREAEAQARQERIGATQEIIRGKQASNEIMDRVVDTLASQRVAFASAGINPFSGSASRVAADQVHRGEAADRVTRDNAAVQWFTRRQASLALIQRGQAAGLGGTIGALGKLAGGKLSAAARGA
jgi:hypothetical protein